MHIQTIREIQQQARSAAATITVAYAKLGPAMREMGRIRAEALDDFARGLEAAVVNADVIRWMASPAVPKGFCIITSDGIVAWVGHANALPEDFPWPSPIVVCVDPQLFDIIKERAAKYASGTPAGRPT